MKGSKMFFSLVMASVCVKHYSDKDDQIRTRLWFRSLWRPITLFYCVVKDLAANVFNPPEMHALHVGGQPCNMVKDIH